MTERTVTVHLNAAVTRYLSNMKAAENQTARVRGGLKAAGDAAVDTGGDLTRMGRDVGFLGHKIEGLRGELRKLAVEFDKTGDAGILERIGQAQRELAKLARISKLMLATSVASAAAQAGVQAGTRFGYEFTASLRDLRGPAIGVLVGLGVAAAPAIGAAISSAVLGGAGAGGIIGGVALAARDARVQDEAARLGAHLGVAFSRAGEPFVAPTIAALRELRGVADDVSGDLRRGFASVAPVFLPLVRGISGLVDESMPGFLRALEEAKPVIRAIANELPAIGRSISDFFDAISEESDGAILGFITLSKLIQATIRGTGQFLGALSATYERVVRFAAQLAPILEALYGWIPGVGDMITTGRKRIDEAIAGLDRAKDASGDFSGGLDGIAESASKAEHELQLMRDEMDRLFGRTMDLRGATRAYEEAVDDLVEAVQKNGKAWTEGTEQGREVQAAIDDNIRAIKDLRDANIENKMSVEQANAIYDQQLERLRRTLINLGLNKDAVNALINEIKAIPAIAETEVRTPGLLEAIRRARELRTLLGSAAAAANFSAGNEYVSGRRWGGVTVHAQSGMLRDAGIYSPRSPARYAFAEPATGGEAFIPRFGDYERSMSILSEAAGWYGANVTPGAGGQTVVHQHHHTYTIQLSGRELMSGFRKEIQFGGGRVQDVAGSRPS